MECKVWCGHFLVVNTVKVGTVNSCTKFFRTERAAQRWLKRELQRYEGWFDIKVTQATVYPITLEESSEEESSEESTKENSSKGSSEDTTSGEEESS